MANNLGLIDKKDLCKIVTPKLVNNIVGGLFWAEDNGWSEREDVDKLQIEIDKIAGFCDIVRPKNERYGEYIKKQT